jgi:hypothetical protein
MAAFSGKWQRSALVLMSALLVFFVSLRLPVSADAPPLRINEFQAANSLTLADEDGDTPDWIELYNPGPHPVTLTGYGLSDNSDRPFKWRFPAVTMPADSFLLVWASGKDRATPGQPLHTGFSISSGGEPLLLTHPELGTVDHVPAVAVPRDRSYGRSPTNPAVWGFYATPTPGKANQGTLYNEVVAPPLFSRPGGFYTDSFALTITSADPAVTILYTLDGSEPHPANLSGTAWRYKNNYPQNPGDPFGNFLPATVRTHTWQQPIPVTDASARPDLLSRIATTWQLHPDHFPVAPLFKGTVVRARAFKPGALPSDIVTHTWFITPQGRDRYTLPVIALTVPPDQLFDYDRGIYVAGVDFDTWRQQNPAATILNFRLTPANFRRAAFAPDAPPFYPPPWQLFLPVVFKTGGQPVTLEQYSHLELFAQEQDTAVLAQGAGLRIHGGASRGLAMKSLRLYARGEYGASTFDYPFFPDLADDSFKRLLLRNSGNDYGHTLLRDAAVQRIMQPLVNDTQAYQPALLFINGEYWGVHNIREHFDKHYLARVWGVDGEQIDYLSGALQVDAGDRLHYDATIHYIQTHGAQDAAHYAWIGTRIDLDSFIDHQIANIFAANLDWPGNNVDLWRLRTAAYLPGAPSGHDGRWRWMLKDMDVTFGLTTGGDWHHDTLAFAAAPDGPAWPNPPRSTFLFRSLLENESFRQRFINRFADLLNSAFLPEETTAIITAAVAAIAPEIPEHINRWRAPALLSDWNGQTGLLVRFAAERPAVQWQQLREFFSLPGEYTLTVAVNNRQQGHVRVNTLHLQPGLAGFSADSPSWTGRYFQNVPVTLHAIPAPGHRFVRWEGLPPGTSAETVQNLPAHRTVTAVFAPLAATP